MKVAIIGAGINGLYLAWKLSERGNDVTVFEKRGEIGKETCSGLFSERILEFVPQSQKLIQNQIDYCLIHWVIGDWLAKRTIKIKFSRRFFVMSHAKLDNLVANLAKLSGAKITLNYNISESDINILYKEFEKIIGCDGPNSIVRKSLGEKEPQFRLGMQVFTEKSDVSDFVEVWPTTSGFLWKVPRANFIEYGIIEDPKRAKMLFEDFLKKKMISFGKISSALVPQGLIIPNNPKITLGGDAAGLTKPWSGGGVIWGLMAANLLLKNFPDFLKYQKEAKKFFLPKIIFSKIVMKMVYFLGFNIPWLIPKNIRIESDFLI